MTTRERAHLQALSSRLPSISSRSSRWPRTRARRATSTSIARPRSACRRSSVRARPSADGGDRAARAGRRARARRRARAPGDSRSAAASRSTCCAIVAASSCWPAASARSASCASTASGVFSPCARSPALAIARCTARSRCVEQRIEIVHQRLHLGRIAPVELTRARPSRTSREPRAAARRTAPGRCARATRPGRHGRRRRQRRPCDRAGARRRSRSAQLLRRREDDASITANSPSVQSTAPSSTRAAKRRSSRSTSLDAIAEPAHAFR